MSEKGGMIMRCAYCGTEITNYPDNGICVNCGGQLPARPAGIRCPACGIYSTGNFCTHCGRSLNGSVPPVPPVQPGYSPVQPRMPYGSGVTCCPKCRSICLMPTTRGFSWGLAILGFFLIPVFGIFLGFCGSKKPRIQCANCGRKW